MHSCYEKGSFLPAAHLQTFYGTEEMVRPSNWVPGEGPVSYYCNASNLEFNETYG
jgi:hypothetical protein